MNFRRIAQQALLCLAVCSYAAAQVNPGSSLLFQLPLPGSGGTNIQGYVADTTDLNADVNITSAPANANTIIPTPDGTRVYLVTPTSLHVFSTNLDTIQQIPGIAGPIRNTTMTPDGKYLLIAGAQFYILSTATNAVVATNLGVSGEVADIAVSFDSTKAWVLQAIPFFNSITPINLTNLSAGAKVSILRAGETITYSPRGKLYVPTRNAIAEYNANTLVLENETQMAALPGRMHFTLDGTKAYFVDKAGFQAFSLVAYNAISHSVAGWPANINTTYAPVLDEIYVASPGKIFGLERSKTTLWQITDEPLSGQPISMAGFESNLVRAAAVSNEIPSARFLYVLTENSARPTVARVFLGDGSLETFANATLGEGLFRYVGIPPQTGASQILKFNDGQVLPAGGAAKTLMAYVTDTLGRPLHDQVVTFVMSSLSPNATITNASARTNSFGYVQADVTVPAAGGTYTIDLIAESATTSFTITVPTTGGGGGGGGNTPLDRMIITRGNGQLIAERESSADWAPLQVRLLNAAGGAISGAQVDFSVTAGDGFVFPPTTITDENGYASTRYNTSSIPSQVAFTSNTILATSVYGSAEFTQLVYHRSPEGFYIPMTVSQPTFFQATVGRGDIIPNFYNVEIRSTLTPDIGKGLQGFGVRVGRAGDLEGEDFRVDAPEAGACINGDLSDNNGNARCDFQVSCSLTSPATVKFVAGETFLTPIVLFPKPGSGQKLTYIAGNNQVGNVGQLLSNRLTAAITDNCGDPVAGQSVIWEVTQGGATLTSTISTSNNDGQVSTAVTLGQTAGTVKITAILGNSSVVFTLTGTVSVSSISLTSGGGQSVLPSQAFPNPIVFTLRTANGTAVGPNINASFALSGGGSLSVATATTNALGQVQTSVTAGPNPGTVVVTATYANLSASASLTVRAPTLPLNPASFSNAASGVAGLVPCGLATAVGSGLVPTPGVISGISPFGPLPYSLGNVESLRVNNVPAPIQAVSNQNGKQQINFQVPCETTVGNATVVVRVNGVETSVGGVPVYAGQPGIFTYAGPNNKLYGAVIRVKDGSYVTPSNLAPTGESFYLILTGLGTVNPATTTNAAGNNQAVNLPTQVGENNAGVPTQTARYLQGSIGVYYVEFTIPKTSNAAPGTVLRTDTPLAAFVTINGAPVFSQPGVLLPGVIQGQ